MSRLSSRERIRAVVSQLQSDAAGGAMQKMIVSSRKEVSVEEAVVVTTPLDAIMRLERPGRIATVVLAGSFATSELASCLSELYPALHIECEA